MLAALLAAVAESGRLVRLEEALQQAGQSLLSVLLVVAGLAIWAVVFVPIWVPALLLIRRWRRPRAPMPPAMLPPPAA